MPRLLVLGGHAQSLLGKRWLNPGTRAVAEETLLSATRVVRALHNLDATLPATSAAPPRHELSAKSKAEKPRSRSPRRDERPPIERRAPSREASEAKASPPEPPSPPRARAPSPPRARAAEESKKKKKKKKGKGRGGGSRHQKHYQAREDPFRVSHRRLSDTLRFARDLDSGLERGTAPVRCRPR